MIEKYIQKLIDELYSRGYSRKTIKTYLTGFNVFYRFLKKQVNYANNEDFKKFKIFLIDKNTEPKTINTYLASIKFFYRNI